MSNRAVGRGAFFAGMLLAGAVSLGVALYGFAHFHRHWNWEWALGCMAGAGVGLAVLIVYDYLGTHVRWLRVPLGIVILSTSFLEPRFGVGLAFVLWAMAAQAARTSRKPRPSP